MTDKPSNKASFGAGGTGTGLRAAASDAAPNSQTARRLGRLDETDWVRGAVVGGVWAAFLVGLTSVGWEKLLTGKTQAFSSLAFHLPEGDKLAIVILAPITGSLVAAALHPLMLYTALGLMVCAMLVVGLSQYLYAEISPWWGLPIIGLLGAGTTTFHLKGIARGLHMESLRGVLSSFLPPKIVERITQDPSQILLRDREVSGTAMVVEIGSFSALATQQSGDDVRSTVGFTYESLRRLASQYGGILVPGHRNGFLCVFGDLFLRDAHLARHAESALQCAIELHKLNVQRAVKLSSSTQLVTSLKIGIASGRVNVGNIGEGGPQGEARSVVPFFFGDPVEMGRALQKACDSNRILMSSITKDLLTKAAADGDWLTKRMVTGFGEGEDLVESYEYDPLASDADLKRRLMEAMRASQRRMRKDERWPVKWPERVQVLTSLGEGMLLNLSRTGLGLRLGQSLGVGTILRISFAPMDPELASRLAKRGIGWVTTEVRWASAGDGGFQHGIIYKNMTAADREFLFLCLLDSQESRTANIA